MDYLAFLLAVLHASQALCEEIIWDTTIKFAEDMTLECVSPLNNTITQKEWSKVNGRKKESVAVYSTAHGVFITKPYEDRLRLLKSASVPNDVVLSFYNASEADVGIYFCFVHTFPTGSWEKIIQVVPPGSFEIAPLPNSHVFSESGKNITLTYGLQKNWSAQLVTWEKMQPNQIDLLTCCNLSQGKMLTSKYSKQVLTTCSQGGRTSNLFIPQATAADSGLYRCRFQASTGENDTFVLRLTISEGKTHNQSIFFIIGGTASVFVILIIAIIVISCNRRRRRRRMQKSVPFKESWDTKNKVASDNRSPISASYLLDDTREDIYVNYPTFSRRPKPRT